MLTRTPVISSVLPSFEAVKIWDTDESNRLTLDWNENDTADRILNFLVNGANRNINLSGDLTLAGNLTTSGAFALTFTLTAATNVTLPTTGTLATLSNHLGEFAATTSAQLAGVISDETGSGALVFATSPTFVTPTLGQASATTLDLSSTLYLRTSSQILNKAGTGWVTWLTRNAGGSEAVADLSNIGNISFPFSASLDLADSINFVIGNATGSNFYIGANGTTNPVFYINLVSTDATGIQLDAAAAGSGIALSAISSGVNENLTIDAKGSGTITLGGTSTGNIKIARSIDLTGSNPAIDIGDSQNFVLGNATGSNFYIGPAGTTNPVIYLPLNTANVTGLQITPAGAGSKIALSAISSGTNESFTIDAKGSGDLLLQGTSTGKVGIGITTSPGAQLEVKGNGTGNILLGSAGFVNYGAISLNGTLSTTNYNFTSAASDPDLYINVPTGADFRFRVNNATPELLFIETGGNIGIGIASFGTNAVKVLAIASGTAPTTSPTDATQLWSADRGGTAGKGSLHIRTEDGTSHVLGDVIGLGTTTPGTNTRVDVQSSGANAYLRVTSDGDGYEAGIGPRRTTGPSYINTWTMVMIANSKDLYFHNTDGSLSALVLTTVGNVGIGGQSTFGTSAAKVLGIASGTAPSTSPADAVQLWSADRGGTAGKGSLHIRTEDGTSHVLGDLSGIGITTPDGTLHVHTATAGAVGAASTGDDLVVENSADGGISILTPDASYGRFYFGAPSDNLAAQLAFSYNEGILYVSTEMASGGQLSLRTGAGTEAIRINASQQTLVKQLMTVGSSLSTSASFAVTLNITGGNNTSMVQVGGTLTCDTNSSNLQAFYYSTTIAAAATTGSNAYGMAVQPTFTKTTGNFANIFTLYVDGTYTSGATSAVYGLYIDPVSGGTSNNYGLYVAAPTGTGAYAGIMMGRVGVNVAAPAGQLDASQDSVSGAIPVLKLTQADVSEEFMRFIGSAAAATLTQSIVAEGAVTTATRQGFLKVYVQDDGNQITDQAYYVPIFTLA